MTEPAENPVPTGVYRPGTSIANIEAYEAFLGMPPGTTVSYVLDFMLDQPAWDQFEAGALQKTANSADSSADATGWAGQLGGRTLMLGVPACVGGTTWAREAAGENDAHWQALGTTLVNAGLGSTVLRIGREFNGSWYPWQVAEGGQADYIAGYSHVVSVLDSLPGAEFTFMWNPTIGVGNLNRTGTESCYPGDDVVDVIGVDLYDFANPPGIYPPDTVVRTAAQQQTCWHSYLTEWDGLTGWQSLATNHGKPLAYPEWGLVLWRTGSQYLGGGDNPVFIEGMATWMKDNPAWMGAFWEDTGMGVMDPDDSPARLVPVPQARRAFLDAFGY
jgi:hypothetical protein